MTVESTGRVPSAAADSCGEGETSEGDAAMVEKARLLKSSRKYIAVAIHLGFDHHTLGIPNRGVYNVQTGWKRQRVQVRIVAVHGKNDSEPRLVRVTKENCVNPKQVEVVAKTNGKGKTGLVVLG